MIIHKLRGQEEAGCMQQMSELFTSCTTLKFVNTLNAKQKHLGYKKVRGQSEAACKQADTTKSFDIS